MSEALGWDPCGCGQCAPSAFRFHTPETGYCVLPPLSVLGMLHGTLQPCQAAHLLHLGRGAAVRGAPVSGAVELRQAGAGLRPGRPGPCLRQLPAHPSKGSNGALCGWV